MDKSNLTADSELISTLHDRNRRAERQIDKITLLEARRYGMAERAGKGRIKYTYAGHVFVYDPKQNKAITSWKIDANRLPNGKKREQKKKEATSGTKFYKPLLIQGSDQHKTDEALKSHEVITAHVQNNKDKWTSHTVLVVDMSGSMRDDDVDGARCRSDGVWTSLARDFVKSQLELKLCSVYDVVSVVIMQETAKVLIECEPLTYVLYNKLVDLREWDNLKPRGHGLYRPALRKAKELLFLNPSGKYALTLMFCSDGKPSDYHGQLGVDEKFNLQEYRQVRDDLAEETGEIASRFGRRLNLQFIGMAGKEVNFITMARMAKEAKLFGAQASFNRPELNVNSLSKIMISSVASSLASKLEISSLSTSIKTAGMVNTRSVRMDVERERQNAPDDSVLNSSWKVFLARSNEAYVRNVWAWNKKVHDFGMVVDPRCNNCYNEDINPKAGLGKLCEGCKCCFFCDRCVVTGAYDTHRRSSSSAECAYFANQRRQGFFVTTPKTELTPLRYNVAWKKKAFGEGAERLAYKFRYLDKNKRFEGTVMVAKESRFTENLNKESAVDYLTSSRQEYHRTFMSTQSLASTFAKSFNSEVKKIPELKTNTNPKPIPKIHFIQPLIFELEDVIHSKTYNLLVEPFIGGKYQKFTDNFGFLRQESPRDFASENEGVDLSVAANLLGREYNDDMHKKEEKEPDLDSLDAIEEGSEGEEDEDEDPISGESKREDLLNIGDDGAMKNHINVNAIRDTDFLDAFSHFTYVKSGKTCMVVDLQGALQESTVKGKDKKKIFVLTDPAIHYRPTHYTHENKSIGNRKKPSPRFGRTDLGVRGIMAFFKTHKCNDVCRLLDLDKKRPQI